MRQLVFVLCLGLSALTLAGLESAAHSGHHDKIIEARHQLMKTIGANTKAIGGLLRSGDLREIPAKARVIAAEAGMIREKFRDPFYKGNSGDVRTTASEAIWRETEKFFAIGDDLAEAADKLAEAAAGGDKGATASAFGAMTRTCGACHKRYRTE